MVQARGPRLFSHFSFLVIFFMIVSYNLGGHGYVHADCGDNRQAECWKVNVV